MRNRLCAWPSIVGSDGQGRLLCVSFLVHHVISKGSSRIESGWVTTGVVRSASPHQTFISRCSTPALGILGREDYLGYASRGHHIRRAQAFTETSDFRHRQYLMYVCVHGTRVSVKKGLDMIVTWMMGLDEETKKRR